MRPVMSGLVNWQQWLWVLNVGAQIALCYLLVRRRAYKWLPFLSLYLLSDLARSAVILVSYRVWGFSSWTAYIVAWSAQTVVVVARGLAVAEVCRNSLRDYRGIWALGRLIIAGVAAVVMSYAALTWLAARYKTFLLALARTVLAADRGLELAIAAVLLSLLTLARYYGIALRQPQKALAVGFCFFSCISVLNNTVLSWWLQRHAVVWNGIEMSSYSLVLVAWCRALYKLVPIRPAVPALIPQATYEEFAPQFNYRLRLLNDRLMGMLKT